MKINDKLIATRFPEELIEKLDEVAKQEDRTRSQVLRKIVKRYVNTMRSGKSMDEFYSIDPFAVV
jgi:predicted DNA-binding protein